MLKRIEVKNFKSLKHVDFKCAGLNLLMGLNGAGKSSFVQLMEVLRVVASRGLKNLDTIPLKDIESKGKFSDFVYCYAPKESAIDVTMDFSWRKAVRACRGGTIATINSLNHLRAVGDPNEKADGASISRCFVDGGHGKFGSCHPALINKALNSSEWCELRKFESEHGGRERIERPEADEDVYRQWFVLYDKAVALKKRIEDEVEAEEGKLREDLSELWKHAQKIDAFRGKPEDVHEGDKIDSCSVEAGDVRFDSEGDDVVEFLYKFGKKAVLFKDNPMRRCGKEVDESCLLDEVNRWMSVVSPGADIEIERHQCGDDEMFVEKVEFGDGGERRSFKPQNVGFGISYTLPVIVALLTAQPEDIIIIENPEAHLHPKGQAAMGNLIARAVASGVQVFVETHSDHVVNGIRAAVKDGIVKPSDVNIAFFERKEHDVPEEDGTSHQEIYSEVRNIRVDKNGSLSEYPDGFLDEWNNQLMELI